MNKTVTIDEVNMSVDIKDSFGSMDKMRLAAEAPDGLVKAKDTDDIELTDDVLHYLKNTLKKATDINDSDIDDLTAEEFMHLSSTILNTIFDDSPYEESSRVKRARVTEQCIETLFKGDMAMIAGMPDSASFENFNYDPSRNELQFIFSCEKWDEIPEGAEIPLIQIHVIQRSGDV